MTEQTRIRISFDRESICMGDDSIDHCEWLTVDELRRTPGFLGVTPVVVQGETPYRWKLQS